jgi:hypothetical protein
MRLRTAAESVPAEKYKSELKAAFSDRAFAMFTPALIGERSEPSSASFLAQEFSGFLVDEMKPGVGEADDGRIGIGTGGIGTGLVRRGRRKPMLYVGAQPRTFEKDMSAHTREYAEAARWVTSVWLRSWSRPAGKNIKK